MYSRFLGEAAEITGDPALSDIGDQLRVAGDQWQVVAGLFQAAHREPDPAGPLAGIPALLRAIADIEAAAWADLLKLAQIRQSENGATEYLNAGVAE